MALQLIIGHSGGFCCASSLILNCSDTQLARYSNGTSSLYLGDFISLLNSIAKPKQSAKRPLLALLLFNRNVGVIGERALIRLVISVY